MRATKDHKTPGRQTKQQSGRLILIVSLVVVGALLFLLTRGTDNEENFDPIEQQILSEPEVETAVTQAPPTPEPPPPFAEPQNEPPLPSLGESDVEVHAALGGLGGGSALQSWVPADDVVRRLATFASAASQGALLRTHLMLPVPSGKFKVEKSTGVTRLSDQNYRRYEPMIHVVESVNIEKASAWYRRYYPLLQQAYLELGNTDRQLDTAVRAALRQVIDAPVPQVRPKLELDSVLYRFSDARLESLPALQKLMIRMGPDNAIKLKVIASQALKAIDQS